MDEADLTLSVVLDTVSILRAQGYTVVASGTGPGLVARLGAADMVNGILTDQGVHNDIAAWDRCADEAGAQVLVGIYFDAARQTPPGRSAVGLFPPGRTPELVPFRNRLIKALRFETIAIGPFVVYLLFLSSWLQSAPTQNSAPQAVPIPERLSDIFLLILPAIVAVWAFRPSNRNWRSAHAWPWLTLSTNVLALTGFMIIGRSGVYYSWSFSTVFRYYIPVALGAVVSYGCMQRLTQARSMLLAACFSLTMVALPVLAGTGL